MQQTHTLRSDLRTLGRGIDGLVDALTLGPTHGHTTILFQKAIYLWVLAYALLLLPGAPQFWGEGAYVLPRTSGWLDRGLNLLHNPTVAPYWPFFLLGQVVFATLGLFGLFPRLAALGLFFCVKNLASKAWMMSNGGNNVLELMLLFNLFMHPRAVAKPTPLSMANNVLANMAFLAARIQLCMIYATSGLSKVTGKFWAHGVGVYYVLNGQEFTNDIGRLLGGSDVLVTVGSFATIAFMVTFPCLVWFHRTRWLVLLVGVFLHLQIALIMGLVDFGTIMILCYILFLPDPLSKRIIDAFHPTTPAVVFVRPGTSPRLLSLLLALGNWRGLVSRVELGADSPDVPAEAPLHGIQAAWALAGRVPLAWPAVPVLAALDYLGVSESLIGARLDRSVAGVAVNV